MLTAENWCVKVDERVYGPYSSQQLRKFAHEGRLAGKSLIAPAGSREWREAQSETTFSSFFGASTQRAGLPGGAERGFGRKGINLSSADSPASAPEGGTAPGTARRAKSLGPTIAARAAGEQPAPANFVLIFDVVNAAASRVEGIVQALGPAFRIADNVWSVNCALTAIGVRNAVAPFLRPQESIFVVDATHGRSSWQNYAPETHSKIAATYLPHKRQ